MARQRIHTTFLAQPWGMITGLLMFALVTLIGLVQRLDPFLIVMRAVMGATITGCVVSLTAKTSLLCLKKKRKSWQR